MDWIVHITDTHFARRDEDLRFRPTSSISGRTIPGPFAPVFARIRSGIVQNHGCRSAEKHLWDELLALVRAFAKETTDPWCLVHSGDVTQAGQLKSFHEALDALETAAGMPPIVVPGNHDLWPQEFPAFAASRTARQWRDLRDAIGVSLYPVATAASGTDFLLFDSSIADSLLNTTALGCLDDEGAPPVSATQNRFAVIHHPPIDGSTGAPWWRSLQQSLSAYFPPVGMIMIDAAGVRRSLLRHGVIAALCGHEHGPPPNPSSMIVERGALLVLQGACPTLANGLGNSGPPQFAIYAVDRHASSTELHWFVCRLNPVRVSHFATYVYQNGNWRVGGGAPPRMPLAAYRQPGPFRRRKRP